jgi:hypothetical protein
MQTIFNASANNNVNPDPTHPSSDKKSAPTNAGTLSIN